MTIDELLDIMDETLEEATTLPFTGGKRMVDVEKVRDIMDDIRLSMPQEIKQARAIVEDRGRIVDDANKEAEASRRPPKCWPAPRPKAARCAPPSPAIAKTCCAAQRNSWLKA